MEGYLSVKTDMSKAFDRVEWGFLRSLLLKMGFSSNWVEKVMCCCVETVKYRVRINGNLTCEIIPSRGLRQSDPISPYLFIICQEWLSSQLLALQRVKRIEGVNLARGLQRVNHMFFADDCLLFIKAELPQLWELKKLLWRFEKIASQKVNNEKSEFTCSPNLEDTMKKVFADFLDMKHVQTHSKYLGLSLSIGQSRRATFKELEEKIRKKSQIG